MVDVAAPPILPPQCKSDSSRRVMHPSSAGGLSGTRRAHNEAPMDVKGRVCCGAGRPGEGATAGRHALEGRLLSGHASARSVGVFRERPTCR